MLQTLRNAFKVPEIRNKLFFVGLILILYRIGAVMPVPFVDSNLMNIYLEQQGSGSFFNYMNILSGSAFGYGTLFALSVSPYITSSIVLQLLDVAFPKWFGGPTADPQEKRKKMTVWTRIITIILAVLTSWGYYAIMKNNGVLDEAGETLLGAIVIIVCYCAGAALIMWLAEKIEDPAQSAVAGEKTGNRRRSVFHDPPILPVIVRQQHSPVIQSGAFPVLERHQPAAVFCQCDRLPLDMKEFRYDPFGFKIAVRRICPEKIYPGIFQGVQKAIHHINAMPYLRFPGIAQNRDP